MWEENCPNNLTMRTTTISRPGGITQVFYHMQIVAQIRKSVKRTGKLIKSCPRFQFKLDKVHYLIRKLDLGSDGNLIYYIILCQWEKWGVTLRVDIVRYLCSSHQYSYYLLYMIDLLHITAKQEKFSNFTSVFTLLLFLSWIKDRQKRCTSILFCGRQDMLALFRKEW